jgi:TPR repeat protein
VFAEQQRRTADQSRKVTEEQRAVAEEQRAVAEEQRTAAQEQREQADRILEGATKVFRKLYDQMDLGTKKEMFAVFKTGTDHGDVTSMVTLGWLYSNGEGVAQDYAKACEW